MEQHKQPDDWLRDFLDITYFTEAVSEKIHGLLDEMQIYSAVMEQFVRSGKYTASILLLTDDRTKLKLAMTSLSPARMEAISRLEKTLDVELSGYEFPLNEGSVYWQVAKGGKTLYASNRDIIHTLFATPVADLITQTLGYEKSGAILSPLRRDGQIVGVFTMSCPAQPEYLIPIVRSLAQRISNGLDMASECARRKEREEALQASENRFRQMAAVIPLAFWMLSPDWKQLIYASPAVEKIYGYPCESFYRQPNLWLDVIHADDRQRVLDFWAEHHGEKSELEYRIVRPDGMIRWIRVVTAPVRNEGGELVMLTGFVEDTTERKQLEAQATQAAKLAALGVLAGGIAHELRNPLAVIATNAELLLGYRNGAQRSRECVEKICAATQRASHIIENLLRFASPHGGRMVQIDVQSVLEDTIALLIDHMALQKVTLQKEFRPGLPKVQGNAQLLQLVFTNLMLNACNAMPRGGMLTLVARPADAGWVEIVFRDNGHGIAPEHLPNIFDPFYTTMPPGKGTGLGLAVSYSIIQRHHGTIEVQSQVGKGATFTVRLPSKKLSS